MRKYGYKHILFIFVSMCGAAPYFLSEVAHSASECRIYVEVNDTNSTIAVNDKNLGRSPISFSCENTVQKLHVTGSDGQVFDRLSSSIFLDRANSTWPDRPRLVFNSVSFLCQNLST